MATEKLTIVPPITVRVTESEQRDIKMLSDYRGMNQSEYFRHLVLQDKKSLKREFDALSPLFIGVHQDANDAASDSARHE